MMSQRLPNQVPPPLSTLVPAYGSVPKAPLIAKISQEAQDLEKTTVADRPLSLGETLNNAFSQNPSAWLVFNISFFAGLIPSFQIIKAAWDSKRDKGSSKPLKESKASKEFSLKLHKQGLHPEKLRESAKEAVQKLKAYQKRLALKWAFVGAGIGILGALGVKTLSQFYTPQAHEKAQSKMEAFNREKGVQSQLRILPVANSLVYGEANAVSGNLSLNPMLVKDVVYSKWLLEPIMNHELKHLEQYILMASSPHQGLERLNLLNAKKMAAQIKKEPTALAEIQKAHQEILQGLSEEDQQKTMPVDGFNMSTPNFVEAMYTLIYKKNVQPKDIPMIINEAFYKKAAQAHGPLSPQEVQKAELYFKAWEQYSPVQWTSLLPWSKYKNNLLEQEAFDTMPWYAK
ncbi:MAG: hypothetical protein HEQ32_03040 [Vampirovibrio sp.]